MPHRPAKMPSPLLTDPLKTKSRRRRAAVRVTLERVNSEHFIAHPPHGQTPIAWRRRLRAALATTSDDFVDATLLQIQYATRIPWSGISAMAVNAALAMIESVEPKPRNEFEAAPIIESACIHAVVMGLLTMFGSHAFEIKKITALSTVIDRLLRGSAAQMEAQRRLNHGGSRQYIRVEHVHLNEGSQAMIGTVSLAGRKTKPEQ